MIKYRIFFFSVLAIFFAGCKNDADQEHVENEGTSIQYTVYTPDYELFIEADPFVREKKSGVLLHLTRLADFKPVENDNLRVSFSINGEETNLTVENPEKKGIYSFSLRPVVSGSGQLIVGLETDNVTRTIVVPGIEVFETEEEADQAAYENTPRPLNASLFTREQSWKTDFATALPVTEPFGQVIRTTALIMPSGSDEIIISAKTNGIINLTDDNILEGTKVVQGQELFTISGSSMAEGNSEVRYYEALNDYEKAKAGYERSLELASDKIVSEKDLESARNIYENARITYENLKKNFSSSGQKISSPFTGYISILPVKNGEYVDSGEPVVTIAQNRNLLLRAEVSQKNAALLASVRSANIRQASESRIYTLEELNGRIISTGRNGDKGSYLIPVNIAIENTTGFITGGFVEVYLTTRSGRDVMTIPATSLLEEQGVYFVYVQITPELFEKREVKPGVTDGIKTEIISGIGKDERIVTKGAILIKLSQASGALDPHAGHVH